MHEVRAVGGQSLEGKGVTPELFTVWTADAVREGRDPALDGVATFVEEMTKMRKDKAEAEDTGTTPAANGKGS